MKILRYLLLYLFLFIGLAASCQQTGSGSTLPGGIYADFNTNKGVITVKLDYIRAPMTVANFIGLAEGTITNKTYPVGKPFYSGSIWHRVVKGHVIQGGEPSVVKDPANSEVSSTGYEIPNEISDLSHNKAGMIGMANSGPHTNTCQYYITLADRSYLDGNYTLFGEVVMGMDVVNKIVQGDTTYTITIRRQGSDAEKFIVNDVTFRALVDRQWKKVKEEKELRKASEEKFISDNYKGLTTLPDGLRYKVLEPGIGMVPSDSSVLSVTYSGRLINGLSFTGSSDEGKPVPDQIAAPFTCSFGSEGLVIGLKEALRTMKAGEKRLVIIPPDLGYGINNAYYGKATAGQKRFVISPGETLIIEVTLNSFNGQGK
jgi:cyclophilin family peptidyl-prolyl cis-trans isomerase